MNCQEARERLAGRAVEALPDDETAQFDEHLEHCLECQSLFLDMHARLGALGDYFDREPAPTLASQTMARVRVEAALPQRWWVRWGHRLDEALQSFASHRPTPLTGLVTTMVAAVLLISVLSPNLMRGRSSGAVVGCRSNLRVLDKALEHYARAHQGHFPAHLADMSPDFLRALPDCPSAGHDTYSSGYQVSADQLHFTLACHGDNHAAANLSADQPEIRR